MSADGAFIAAAVSDGSVQIFDGVRHYLNQSTIILLVLKDGPWTRPKLRCSNAHVNGSETSDIRFSGDNSLFITRGGGSLPLIQRLLAEIALDDTVKVWDVRMFQRGAVKEFNGLPNKYSMSRVAWSPDQRLFVVGALSPTRTRVSAYSRAQGRACSRIRRASASSPSLTLSRWRKLRKSVSLRLLSSPFCGTRNSTRFVNGFSSLNVLI